MKTPPIAALAIASFLGLLPSQTQSCSSLDNVKVTFFGYPDNSPPGAGIAWTSCGRSLAGGTGSYDDPITFATAPDGDFKVCDIVYLPYLRKYARYEDDCEQCSEFSPLFKPFPHLLFSENIIIYCAVWEARGAGKERPKKHKKNKTNKQTGLY